MQRDNRMKGHLFGATWLVGLVLAGVARSQTPDAPLPPATPPETAPESSPQATPETSPLVLRVDVEGNQKVPSQTILQSFAVRPGDVFDPGKVSRAVQGLTRK